MFFGNFRKKPPKPIPTQIKVSRIYDTVEMPTSYIPGESLADIQKHPNRWAQGIKISDSLLSLPKMEIIVLEEPRLENNAKTIADITYTYTSARPEPKMSWLTKVVIFITIWSIIGLMFTAFMLSEIGKKHRIETLCYKYFRGGVPYAISIDNTTYDLQSDGSFYKIDEPFINPWHREKLTVGKCIEVYQK